MHRGRARRPKIAELLALPEAAGVLRELRLAKELHTAPSTLRGRQPRITYLHDDPANPERVTGELHSAVFTEDDRALLLGLAAYEDTLCPGCGIEKRLAWHSHAQASWASDEIVCHACTSRQGTQVTYSKLSTSMTDLDVEGLAPFAWGETTTRPDPVPSGR